MPIAAPMELSGLRVVVADEAHDTVELVTSVLQHCGCDVRATTTLEDAMAALLEHRPDVLVVSSAMSDGAEGPFADRLGSWKQLCQDPLPTLCLIYCCEVGRRVLKRVTQTMQLSRPVEPESLVSVVQALALLRMESRS